LIGTIVDAISDPLVGVFSDNVTNSMASELLWMTGPIHILIVYGGLGFALLYNIDRERHGHILKELARRKYDSTKVEE